MKNFQKKLLLLLFIFFPICSISFAEIVKDIQIQGNNRVSDETILMLKHAITCYRMIKAKNAHQELSHTPRDPP